MERGAGMIDFRAHLALLLVCSIAAWIGGMSIVLLFPPHDLCEVPE
jgi:hypothetical protein